MHSVLEINTPDELSPHRAAWEDLLQQTAGATFFQSFHWLDAYWRHFGTGKKLRTLVILDDGNPAAIVPLAIRTERTRVGNLRVLGYPLDNWGSFYGPIGPDPSGALRTAMQHIRRTPRDWDMIELRWIGASGGDARQAQDAMRAAQAAMHAASFQAYPTIWNQTLAVDFSAGWKHYVNSRKGAWLRRMRQSQEKLSRQGKVGFVRCRPRGIAYGEGDAHWDLYDACEAIARASWQAAASDGTTLSHRSIRAFLRDLHATAAEAGAVDMTLLTLNDHPAAFIYGYHYRGSVYGLRRGFDAAVSRAGLGSILLWNTLEDSARRGDRLYDMGVGSLESKRHFQNRSLPIYRLSHFHAAVLRTQLLRVGRWLEGRRLTGAS
jgi:CelD/BcsL family acetyltransferase involved in cellulose biosynthesis